MLLKRPILLRRRPEVVLLFLCWTTLSSCSPAEKVAGVGSISGSIATPTSANELDSASANILSAKAPNEYRAASAYYYPAGGQQYAAAQQPQQWNRDTYSDAATEFGYNSGGVAHVQPHGHAHAQSSYGVPSSSYGVSGYDDDFDFGGGLGGIGGALAALAGLKGLKGLGILGLLKAGFFGIAPLFFLLLPALLLIPLLLIFLPIPVITVPTAGTGRGLSPLSGLNLNEWSGKMTNLARSVMESDKCIERISCEMSRLSRGSIIDKTLKRVISRFETNMPGPLRRMARAYLEPIGCKRYGCFITDDFKRPNST